MLVGPPLLDQLINSPQIVTLHGEHCRELFAILMKFCAYIKSKGGLLGKLKEISLNDLEKATLAVVKLIQRLRIRRRHLPSRQLDMSVTRVP